MFERIQQALSDHAEVLYAFVFGSRARGTPRTDSDLDVAVELRSPQPPQAIGDLIACLEEASGLEVDLVLLEAAPASLAYRVFAEGVPVLVRDREALVRRRARVILEYLDYRPVEDLLTRGALAAARHGR